MAFSPARSIAQSQFPQLQRNRGSVLSLEPAITPCARLPKATLRRQTPCGVRNGAGRKCSPVRNAASFGEVHTTANWSLDTQPLRPETRSTTHPASTNSNSTQSSSSNSPTEASSQAPTASPRSPLSTLASALRPLIFPFVALLLPLLLTSQRPALAEAQAQLQQGAQSAAGGLRISPHLQLSDIAQNTIFMSSFIAWGMAQSLKVVTNFVATRVWDWRMVFASGGMPSSHSAMCCGLTAAVALMHGFHGPFFPIALAFTLIVMYDATSVRYHAGVQAKVLNVVVAEMLQGHPVSEKKLKEILGHTPLQVATGASLGVAVAFLYHRSLGLF